MSRVSGLPFSLPVSAPALLIPLAQGLGTLRHPDVGLPMLLRQGAQGLQVPVDLLQLLRAKPVGARLEPSGREGPQGPGLDHGEIPGCCRHLHQPSAPGVAPVRQSMRGRGTEHLRKGKAQSFY